MSGEEEEKPPEQIPVQVPAEFLGQTFIERHGIPPVLFVGVTLIVLFFLYQGIPAVITFMVYGFNIGLESKLVTPSNVNMWRLFTGLSQILLLLVPTFFLVRFVTNRPMEFVRFRTPKIGVILVPVVGILSLQQMLQIYLFYQEKIPLPESLERLSQQMKEAYEEIAKLLTGSSSVPELLWVILIIAFIPAIAEELLFRGLVQRTLEKSSTPLRAAVATGIIFGAYHLNPASFVPLAVLGAYLGFLAMRADSIWVSMAAHFYNNAFACIAVYYNADDDVMLAGNTNTMSNGELLLTFWSFGVVFLLSTYYYIYLTKPAQAKLGRRQS